MAADIQGQIRYAVIVLMVFFGTAIAVHNIMTGDHRAEETTGLCFLDARDAIWTLQSLISPAQSFCGPVSQRVKYLTPRIQRRRKELDTTVKDG